MSFFIHLRQIKHQIIQYEQVFQIPKLRTSIFCTILNLVSKLKTLQISELQLPQHKDI